MESCLFIGNLGADAEVKSRTSDGGEFITFSLGVDKSYTDKDGPRQKATKWLSCSAAKTNVLAHLKKGTKVAIKGYVEADGYKNDKGDVVTKLVVSVAELELC